MKLPLSIEDQQEICDRANPLEIPALVDALVRCQDALAAVRRENQALVDARETRLEEYRSLAIDQNTMIDGILKQ